MGNTNRRLAVDEETYSLVVKDCIKIFKANNPDFKKINISHNKMVNVLAKYYINN